MNIINVNNISKRYGNKYALSNVSFEVKRGTIHGFIGPNGAGKTTTLSIITRLVLPTSGDVKIEGKSVRDNPEFNKNLGFVPAEPRFPDLSVEEYLVECGYLRDIPQEEVLQKLANSPLQQFANKNCRELSTGWKKILQIFSLKIALSNCEPKIFLLDEPFNGLDPSFSEELFNNIKNMKKQGATFIISMHNLPQLRELLDTDDEVTMIKNGKIVFTGRPTIDIKELYQKHFYEKSGSFFN